MNPKALLLAAFVLLAQPFSAGAQPAALSLHEIVNLRSVTQVALSPQGDRIAYLLSVPRALYEDDDGRPYVELHVVDLEGQTRPYVTGDVAVSSMAWASDGNSIYFLAKREEDAEFNSLYQIALSGGEAIKRFTHESDISAIWPSPDGARMAFLAPEAAPEKKTELEEKGFKALVYEESVPVVELWMLDLESFEATEQAHQGSARSFAWSPDSSQYAISLTPTPLIDDSYTSQEISVADAESGEVRSQLGVEGKLGHFSWSPDGRSIAYIGAEDINDPAEGRLYVSAVSGGERTDVLPNYAGHVEDFIWQDGQAIRYLGGQGVWSDWSIASVSQPMEVGVAPSGGPIIRSVDGAPGQAVVAAVVDTPEHPGEVYLLRSNTDPRRLTNSNPLLSQRTLARQEAMTYEARDGLLLEAIVVYPIGAEPDRNTPLVLFIHGGPEAHYSNGWMSRYATPAQHLAGQGYLVAYPNYRGSTGRGVEFSKLGQNDYAEEEFNDYVDLKRHLVAMGMANPDKVGVSGGSYGGYASMWAATALSEEFAASVAFVGISNQVSKFGTGDIPMEMYNVHARVWPWEDWMWMLQRSPIYHADKARTPLLIMHGDKDPRGHPSQSLEMYRAIKLRTDTPVRLVFYPGEGHGNRNTAAQYDYALRLERWMNHYLKGPGGEPPPYQLDHASRLPEED